MQEYVDTHTHITDDAFAGEEAGYIARALNVGVTKMIHADVGRAERSGMFSLTQKYPGVIFPMLGLYPGNVGHDWRDEIDELMKWTDAGPVAIGEIGLDYHYGADFASEQKEALRVQLELAARLNLPVNIHMREATEDFFSVLSDCRGLGLRGNVHAFSGSYETFMKLQRFGDWRIGIGGVVTFKKASLAEVVMKVPLERMVLETDAPYLTPVPYRGSRNESSMIPVIAAKVAELKGVDIAEVAAVTTGNARELFSI